MPDATTRFQLGEAILGTSPLGDGTIPPVASLHLRARVHLLPTRLAYSSLQSDLQANGRMVGTMTAVSEILK